MSFIFFFFKQKTAYEMRISDWSSDVCSSDLAKAVHRYFHEQGYFWISTPIITTSDAEGAGQMFRVSTLDLANLPRNAAGEVDHGRDFFGKERSEERRVGKECVSPCRSRWAPEH